jgi:ATP-binding cassette, subfamily B, bacterial MsbA
MSLATGGAQDRREGGTVLRIFRTYLKPRWPALAAAMACAAAVGALTAALAWLLDPAVKQLFIDKNRQALLVIPLAIAAVALVRAAAQIGQATLVNGVGNRLVGQIQGDLFSRLIRADLARLRASHSGEHLSSILYDAGLVREAATSGVVNYTQHLLTVVATVAVMFIQDVGLTLIVLIGAPVASLVMRRFSKRTRKAAKGAMNETSALSTAIMESLDGVKIVKIENREAFEEQRVSAVIERRQTHLIKGANARAAAAPVTEAVMTWVTAGVIAYAGWRAIEGGIGINQLLAFLVALGAASQSLRQLANLQSVMSEGLTAAGRLFEVLDISPEIGDAPGSKEIGRAHGDLAFEDVSFAYLDGTPALRGVTLQARRGESIALVGPSGGGKSTLLNLIARFYDVGGGRVTLDGRDVREITLASLREQIALVTQEPFLFDDTVHANIAYARPGASDAEVEAAARAAAAHDFILALPQGYGTTVGEMGGRLSGGQRQRIAIARAFLKDAPILLLDEATSALDTESEARVQEALERLMAGRTTLMIAHRLSTVRKADRIYVIDQGAIVESGTHETLVAEGGLYARLAESQNLDLEAAR